MPKWVFRRFPFLLLDWAVRYFPMLRVLKTRIPPEGLLLDLGSGSVGLAGFHHDKFVGCDVEFPNEPRRPMLPVRCSGVKLPFRDGAFPGVLASDVLEHVPPERRPAVVTEALRVAGKVAIFSFPTGSLAYQADRKLCDFLGKRGIPLFDWLKEHMLHPYPDGSLFEGLSPNWSIESFQNENLRFHEWVNRHELSKIVKGLFWVALTLAPKLVASLLRLADRPPYYRLIVVATKRPGLQQEMSS